jgi:allantoinase
MTERLSLRSRRVATPSGVRDAVVVIEAGRIVAVREPAAGDQVTADFGDHWIMPGLVDTHVHLNDPGRADWEGFDTGTAAALAGGFTTLVDMPLNSDPVTTTVPTFEAKVAAARGRLRCDVGFWGGVVPGNADQLEPLAQRGVLGFKCFLSPSGIGDFENVGATSLAEAMYTIADLGLPLLIHAEAPRVLDEAAAKLSPSADARSYATWLASRPPDAELAAIAIVLDMSALTNCRAHIVHLSAADALRNLGIARRSGDRITIETCPHYLVFDSGSIPDGATEFKCAPPIRDRANRDRLWDALEHGAIDLVATDHSPCLPEMKLKESGDFMRAWGGIASLEAALGAMWREAHARGLAPERLAHWMSEAPARLAGLQGRKGAITEGADADLVVWDPEVEWTLDPTRLHQRHPITPYAGRPMRGRVERVYLRGELVFENGALVGEPRGKALLRGRD